MRKAKLLLLVINSVISFVLFFVPHFILYYIFPGETGYGYFYMLNVIIVWFACFVSVGSFLSAKIFSQKCDDIKAEKAFIWLNSLLLTLPYLIYYLYYFCFMTVLYAVVFGWSYLWSMLGLVRRKPKASAEVLIGQDQA